jgi:hypothetical protein
MLKATEYEMVLHSRKQIEYDIGSLLQDNTEEAELLIAFTLVFSLPLGCIDNVVDCLIEDVSRKIRDRAIKLESKLAIHKIS